MKTCLALAALAVASIGTPALASVPLGPQTYDFSATFSNPATVSGSFTTTYNAVTSTFALNDISFVVGNYTYTTANTDFLVSGSTLYLGGTVNHVNGINAFTSTNDFEATFTFNGSTGAITGINSLALLAPTTNAIEHNLHPTFSLEASAVPEAETWAMMILGMGAVGFAMRRRHKVTTGVSYAA